jgi:hypothetical protein
MPVPQAHDMDSRRITEVAPGSLFAVARLSTELSACPHPHALKQRPHIGAAVAADPAGKLGLETHLVLVLSYSMAHI